VDLLTLGRSQLTIQFGQAGDEDQDDPDLTSLEISLVHLESERDRASDTNLVTEKAYFSEACGYICFLENKIFPLLGN